MQNDKTLHNKMLIDATHPEETRVVVLRQGRVEEFDYESAARKLLRGNIYLAKVTRVEPSLQAAFVEYGGNRHGFLAFNEIHPDYYQIPIADRRALIEAEAAEEAAEEEEASAAADAAAEAAHAQGNVELQAAGLGDGSEPEAEGAADIHGEGETPEPAGGAEDGARIMAEAGPPEATLTAAPEALSGSEPSAAGE
ncbi:MAG TPA: ribonuclease E/G, partial [Hyphomicrobiaceae bacterium]|nr:ribonuclease E/G [Hyphomicrobiaceae bacterium]